ALVTGATSGIGRATAVQLVRHGWKVFAVGRRRSNLESLATDCQDLSRLLIPVAADVTDDAPVTALYDTAEAQGGVDTVVRLSGGSVGAELFAVSVLSDLEWMIGRGVLRSLRVISHLLPLLRATGPGTVLNHLSTAVLVP